MKIKQQKASVQNPIYDGGDDADGQTGFWLAKIIKEQLGACSLNYDADAVCLLG